MDEAFSAAELAYKMYQAGRTMPWLSEAALDALAGIDEGAYHAYCELYQLDPDAPTDPEWT